MCNISPRRFHRCWKGPIKPGSPPSQAVLRCGHLPPGLRTARPKRVSTCGPAASPKKGPSTTSRLCPLRPASSTRRCRTPFGRRKRRISRFERISSAITRTANSRTQMPLPRPFLASSLRTQLNNQGIDLTFGICENPVPFGRRVISQHHDSTPE